MWIPVPETPVRLHCLHLSELEWGAELLLLLRHSVMSSMPRVRQSSLLCWRIHPVPCCGVMAMESHTPKAWLGPGVSQELHRDFVL